MGLDTSHDAWHGSYSTFNEWRTLVAAAAGFRPLREMRGFGGSRSWPDSPGDKRLVPLLHHSDCDGEIAAEMCGPIADALELLMIEKMPARATYDEMRPATERFIAGLRRAAAAGEPVLFR